MSGQYLVASPAPTGAFAIERFHVYGTAGWIEAACWALLVAAGTLWMARGLRHARDLPWRAAAPIVAVAAAARLVVPRLPFNWWYGVANLPWAQGVYTKQTSYDPLPHRLLAFDLGLGFTGLFVFNVIVGVGAVVLIWRAALRSGYDAKVALALALLLALIPAYVRISASDAIHLLPFVLWAAAVTAFVAIRDGRGGWAAHVVLFTATALACQIRAEAALLMPSVPFFVGVDATQWRALWAARRRFVFFALGLALGYGLMLGHHAGSFQVYAERALDFGDRSLPLRALIAAGNFVVSLAFRLLLPTNPLPLSVVPTLLQWPIWIYTFRGYRRRAYGELTAVYLPQALFSIPAVVAGKESVGFLPEAAYHLIYLVFVSLACAKGIAMLAGEWRRWLSGPARRLAAGAAAAALLYLDVVVPYTHTYAYEEEFRFLAARLPRRPTTLLTLWDPQTAHGDYDCCLSLPYPPQLADFPDLRWIVLTADDLETGRWETLDFDAYYPGCLAQVALDRLPERSAKTLTHEDGFRREDEDHLRRLQRLDARIRSRFPFEPIAGEVVPALSFSDYKFAGDRMTLTLYRRTDRPAPR